MNPPRSATSRYWPPTRVHANLLSIVEPMSNVLAAVVRHHCPDSDRSLAYCKGCDPGKYADEGAYWACSTIDLIMVELELNPRTGRPVPREWIPVQIVQPEEGQ